MKYFDQTWADPAANLAVDEILLDLCDTGHLGDILRFWQPRETFVVVGYANRAAQEANLPACQAAGVPVFRRCTGGGTVLQGPGCLNFSLVLRIPGPAEPHPPQSGESGLITSFMASQSLAVQTIFGANTFILERNRAALQPFLPEKISIRGHTDLSIRNLKFSGNSQRRARRALLFHGTFLLDFDLAKISELLPLPSQQPNYRKNRPHSEFLTNLHLPPASVMEALKNVWQAKIEPVQIPEARIRSLVLEKYSLPSWNLKF